MLRESRRVVPPPSDGGISDPWRFGVEANRASLKIIIDYSFRQKLIPRAFAVDELFDDCTGALD
jgi:4,5-dihydroxyphthalate decarboxylase